MFYGGKYMLFCLLPASLNNIIYGCIHVNWNNLITYILYCVYLRQIWFSVREYLYQEYACHLFWWLVSTSYSNTRRGTCTGRRWLGFSDKRHQAADLQCNNNKQKADIRHLTNIKAHVTSHPNLQPSHSFCDCLSFLYYNSKNFISCIVCKSYNLFPFTTNTHKHAQQWVVPL